MNNFEELNVWKKAIDFVSEIYKTVSSFPKEERYGLSSQMKRSAVSIPSNIAEGAGRNSHKEFIRFLSIATGSSYELQTQIILSAKLELIDKKISELLVDMLREIQKMMFGLQKHLRTKFS